MVTKHTAQLLQPWRKRRLICLGEQQNKTGCITVCSTCTIASRTTGRASHTQTYCPFLCLQVAFKDVQDGVDSTHVHRLLVHLINEGSLHSVAAVSSFVGWGMCMQRSSFVATLTGSAGIMFASLAMNLQMLPLCATAVVSLMYNTGTLPNGSFAGEDARSAARSSRDTISSLNSISL